MTPSTSEIFPAESSTPPLPPPPTYPAPEISVWDLTIGPHVISKSNSSSTRPSPTPTRTVVNSTPTQGVVRRVIDDRSIDNYRESMEDSFDYQNSFEDTLQNEDRWSSFEDVHQDKQNGVNNDDDDVSYV